jgi:hypothetical protein
VIIDNFQHRKKMMEQLGKNHGLLLTKTQQRYLARCSFSDRSLHSRMPLDPTHVRVKQTCVKPMAVLSGASSALIASIVNYVETLKAIVRAGIARKPAKALVQPANCVRAWCFRLARCSSSLASSQPPLATNLARAWCSGLNRICTQGVLLGFAPLLRLQRGQACDQ